MPLGFIIFALLTFGRSLHKSLDSSDSSVIQEEVLESNQAGGRKRSGKADGKFSAVPPRGSALPEIDSERMIARRNQRHRGSPVVSRKTGDSHLVPGIMAAVFLGVFGLALWNRDSADLGTTSFIRSRLLSVRTSLLVRGLADHSVHSEGSRTLRAAELGKGYSAALVSACFFALASVLIKCNTFPKCRSLRLWLQYAERV